MVMPFQAFSETSPCKPLGAGFCYIERQYARVEMESKDKKRRHIPRDTVLLLGWHTRSGGRGEYSRKRPRDEISSLPT